jgi:DHA1 family bicyclomycin/chloramphenicol resistance-like MFS transporter
MTLGFGQMMALLSSIQQIYGQAYDRAQEFPYWFALGAAVSALASFTNGRLVGRLGMRRIAIAAFAGQAGFSVLMFAVFRSGLPEGPLAFAAFFVWSTSVFFIAGLTFGNLNALAMQRMGHIAGTASSVISAISTVLAVAIAAPVGLMFDGSPGPVIAAAALCSGLALLILHRT